MAKRKEACIRCGIANQEIHQCCYTCHEMDLGDMAERVITKVGNDNFTRCDEKDCWLCQNWAWEQRGTRPPKYSKKDFLNFARGRYGRRDKQAGIEAVRQRKLAEDQANMRKQRDAEETG